MPPAVAVPRLRPSNLARHARQAAAAQAAAAGGSDGSPTAHGAHGGDLPQLQPPRKGSFIQKPGGPQSPPGSSADLHLPPAPGSSFVPGPPPYKHSRRSDPTGTELLPAVQPGRSRLLLGGRQTIGETSTIDSSPLPIPEDALIGAP